MPAILQQSAPSVAPGALEGLSLFVACILIVMYLSGLLFSLRTHKHLYLEDAIAEVPKWTLRRGITTLLVATLAVAWMSEILVSSIQPLVAALGWSQIFIGVIFLAIVGNAAEHVSALSVARKDKMDLALQVSMGSATQIAMFVAPVLVFVSVFFMQPMNLVFDTFELISIVLSVIIVNLVIADGESNWLEGVQLLGAYAVMAVAFFFHP